MLTVELTQTHVHVGRSPHHKRALGRCQLQCLLVGTHCLARTTLRHPYIRQGDCTIDCVRDVPRLLQTRHALGIRLVRCLEISARPGCEPQEPRCPSARHMVVLWCEVECPLGIGHGRWHIAPRQGQPGMGNRDHARETTKCLVVHHDHSCALLGPSFSRWADTGFPLGRAWSRTAVCPSVQRRVQPPFGIAQVVLNAINLAVI